MLIDKIIATRNWVKTRFLEIMKVVVFKGVIESNADFPTLDEVKNGWFYQVKEDVTDNDATKTNTGKSFLAGDEIVWNGEAWVKYGSVVLWQRTSTTLSPATDNDSVDVGNGTIKTTGNFEGGTHSNLTLSAEATGFKVSGGTTSKELNVDVDTQTSGLVPYTGATGAVDLGTYNLTTTGTLSSADVVLPDQQIDTNSAIGIIYKDSEPFIHNFRHPTGDTARPEGNNLCIGIEAGNLTMGSTATEVYHASDNVFIGYQSGLSNTTGYHNSAQGSQALHSNTTGYHNSAQGALALRSNTTGYSNSAQGFEALHSNTTGYYNSAQGALALYANTTGSYNSAQGFESGRYIADGITANAITNNSVYLGANTKANANDQTNQIVIGYDAIGNGSNTATIGDDNVTDVYMGEDGQAVLHSYKSYIDKSANENTTATAILVTDVVHPLYHTFTASLFQGFSNVAGSSGAITAFADAGGGLVTVTSAGHDLSAGDIVTIRGTTNYEGHFVVRSVDGNDFNITATWVADDATGTWMRGDQIVSEGNWGVLRTSWSLSGSAAANAKDIEFRFVVYKAATDTITECTKCVQGVRTQLASELFTCSSSILIDWAVDDRLIMGVRNKTDTVDITVIDCDICVGG